MPTMIRYQNARNTARINNSASDSFSAQIGVDQDSILRLLLFAAVAQGKF